MGRGTLRDFAAILVAGAFALATLGLVYVPAPKSSSDWAAWAQAVGSILAVAGAAGIALWQSHDLRKREAQTRRAVVALVQEAGRRVSVQLLPLWVADFQSQSSMTPAQYDQFYPDAFMRAEAALVEAANELSELQSIAMPDAELALAIKRLGTCFRSGLQRNMPLGPIRADGTIDRLRARQIADSLRAVVQLHLERLS
jgi:hypothetical protein